MQQLTALFVALSVLSSGCALFATPDRQPDTAQSGPREPVDRNRNSVPDNLERQALPLTPIADRATPPAE